MCLVTQRGGEIKLTTGIIHLIREGSSLSVNCLFEIVTLLVTKSPALFCNSPNYNGAPAVYKVRLPAVVRYIDMLCKDEYFTETTLRVYTDARAWLHSESVVMPTEPRKGKSRPSSKLSSEIEPKNRGEVFNAVFGNVESVSANVNLAVKKGSTMSTALTLDQLQALIDAEPVSERVSQLHLQRMANVESVISGENPALDVTTETKKNGEPLTLNAILSAYRKVITEKKAEKVVAVKLLKKAEKVVIYTTKKPADTNAEK